MQCKCHWPISAASTDTFKSIALHSRLAKTLEPWPPEMQAWYLGLKDRERCSFWTEYWRQVLEYSSRHPQTRLAPWS